MNYISRIKAKNQTQFSQDDPRVVCRYKRRLLETCRARIESKEIDFIFDKCGRVRCSIECNIAYMRKVAACRGRLLSMYVHDVAVYRGNLMMPNGATPAQHKDATTEFLRIMRRWSKKRHRCGQHEWKFEIHAIQHITDTKNCHWDCVAYSDAYPEELYAQVSDAWRRAGGERQSLVEMDSSEFVAVCKYQAKDTQEEIRRKKAERLLPGDGIQCQWSSKPGKTRQGFWAGHTIDDLWDEIREELYDESNSKNAVSEPTDNQDDPNLDPLVARYRAAMKERRAAVRGGRVGSESALLVSLQPISVDLAIRRP